MSSGLTFAIALLAAILGMIALTRFLKLHAFFSLLLAALFFGVATGQSLAATLQHMQTGFGSLLQQIGLLVALGACLGTALEKTGAMEVVSHQVLRTVGRQRTLVAMTLVGVVVGIPVFCDSGFMILSRLVPSVAAQAGTPAAPLSLALAGGLYGSHTLVPPTPGPLAAAANLGLAGHLPLVMGLGLLVSVPLAAVSTWASRRLGTIDTAAENPSPAPQVSMKPWRAFLPLIVPILLIGSSTFLQMLPVAPVMQSLLAAIGHPAIALTIGCLLSVALSKAPTPQWPAWMAEALREAGVILLITGAGGAFGAVIKNSGIANILEDLLRGSVVQGTWFLCVGFLVAAVLKTAQGSTTSAMIVTSSLLAPMAAVAGVASPVQLASLLLAIGGGAMTVSHANDSYFWVVSQFGHIAPRDAMRSFTVLTLLQGLTVLACSILLLLVL
jgi:GntP family gluconate:H+ symporter